MDRILLSPPDVGELEADYVLRAMRSGWVAPAGPDLTAFEEEVAARVGVDHAVGLASGTAALHLAMVSWGVGPGDVVPVSTFTFAGEPIRSSRDTTRCQPEVRRPHRQVCHGSRRLGRPTPSRQRRTGADSRHTGVRPGGQDRQRPELTA